MERCQLFRSRHIPANTGSTEAVRHCFYFCIVYDIYTPIEMRVSTTRGTLLNHGSEFCCLRLENMRPQQHRFLGTATEKLNITKIHNNQPIPCSSHDDRNGAIFYAWFHPFFTLSVLLIQHPSRTLLDTSRGLCVSIFAPQLMGKGRHNLVCLGWDWLWDLKSYI